MTPTDIAELLTRLAIYPKSQPKTLDGVVKLIERQRWEHTARENEQCAVLAEGTVCHDRHDAEHLDQLIAAAIRARVSR